MEIGPALVGFSHHFLGSIRTDDWPGGFVVIEKIDAEIPLSRIRLLAIHEIVEMIPNKGLHLF